MATQIELVNRVLRRLREDTVSNITDDDYARLVAEFVRDTYDQVLDAHDWEALKHRTHVDVVSGQARYRLDAYAASGGDARDTDTRLPNDESELQFFDGDAAQAWMYRNDSDDEYRYLKFMTPEMFRQVKAVDRDDTEPDAFFFTIYRESDATNGRRLFLELFPEPTESRVLELIFWTRPAELQDDGTTDDVDLLIPDRPVYQGTLMYAYNERGEEIGEPGNLAERRFLDSLAAEIEKELRIYERGDRFEWRRD